MSHIDIEVKRIKEKLLEMWDLVDYQFQSGQQAMSAIDHELAAKVIKLGKKVNDYDVKIDRMSENVLALFTPVAIDLRLMLATLKINSSLERIGDDSEGIAYFVQKLEKPLDAELVEATKTHEMYEEAKAMLADCRKAFLYDDTELAKQLIKRDKTLNKIYAKADTIIANAITANPAKVSEGLVLFSIIKKIERVGDQITNIAEEIIFYRDAKVLRHKKKKKKKD
ncbi:phosphate signaling complex protein PhoU [Pontibacter qinzhouensis]|uniref:Phosphate-specific transport system accessory protein PhoU n=1 Tax=Pontibacter qinzhouensis TaxID=2603253 RepID=A0A5C8K6B4_9BACT|nr:phosphate signaling complex protein PhoU [Pontibacter qinzhouensis]TXK44643.1 phosphate signaling complex protein PhoU [Pontibacter qinzhouensis]